MQWPCERENRTGTRLKHARFWKKSRECFVPRCVKILPVLFRIETIKRFVHTFTRFQKTINRKKKKKNQLVGSRPMFPHEIALSKFPLTGIAIEHIERESVKYRLGVARVSACQRVARVLSPPLEGLKEFVDCTRVICASTSTKWLSWRLFRPRVFLRLSVRRRPFSPSWIWRGGGGGGGGGERRGFPSEGAVSLTGRPRGGFAIRGATRSFAVLEGSRERFEKSRLRRLSNNWSDRGKGDVRSPARKFEFRFRMDRLSRRYLTYLNADFARFSSVVGCFSTSRGWTKRVGLFWGGLGEVFFDELGYFVRSTATRWWFSL